MARFSLQTYTSIKKLFVFARNTRSIIENDHFSSLPISKFFRLIVYSCIFNTYLSEFKCLKNKYFVRIIANKKLKAYSPMQKMYTIGITPFSLLLLIIEFLFPYVALDSLYKHDRCYLLHNPEFLTQKLNLHHATQLICHIKHLWDREYLKSNNLSLAVLVLLFLFTAMVLSSNDFDYSRTVLKDEYVNYKGLTNHYLWA